MEEKTPAKVDQFTIYDGNDFVNLGPCPLCGESKTVCYHSRMEPLLAYRQTWKCAKCSHARWVAERLPKLSELTREL